MLSLGPGSSCDVCFERFGKDRKVPISIACGHVFCNTCVAQLSRSCPLCRTPFTQASCIKLHVDIDAVVQECTEEQLNQAQKLQKSMCNIADQGITEPLLRQLIQEGKDFLKTQPKHLHRDLRAFHRVVTYLCEVRSNLRSQKPAVAKLHEEIQKLKGEKAALEKQLAEQEEQYKQDRESSLAVETSLRSSYHDAIDVYHSTIELYNKVAQQNSELMAKLSAHLTSSSSKSSTEDNSSTNNSSVGSLLTPAVTAGNLQEVGIQDPNSSFLISPLPQFTSNLPGMNSTISTLTDIEEENEGEVEYGSEYEREEGEAQEEEEESEDEGLFSEDDDVQHHREVKALESSGLSRTAPKSYEDYRRARSHSHPAPTLQSRSQSPPRSLISPPPTSTSQTSGYTAHHLAAFSYSQHSKEAPSIDTPYGFRDERLQHILEVSPSPSSSWPNSSASYFPASYTNRDTFNYHDGRVSPPDSLTDRSSNSSKTSASSSYQQSSPLIPYSTSTGDKYANMLASSPQSYMNKSALSSSPNPISHGHGLSTASAQALRLEEERRRRKEMEQEKLAQEHGDRLHSFGTESEARRTAVASPAGSTASASTVSSGATIQGPRATHSSFYVDPVITPASMSQWRPPTNNTQSSTYGRSGQSTVPPQPYDQRQPPKYMSSASTSYPAKPPMLSMNATGVLST